MGLLWLLVGISSAEWLKLCKKFLPFTPSQKIKIISVILIFAEIFFLTGFAFHYNPPINEHIEVISEKK